MGIDKQAVYDRVKTHLLQQGRMAKRMFDCGGDLPAYEGCAYLAEDGAQCAVGCLISDEYYNPEMEGCTVTSRMVQAALAQSLGCEIDPYSFDISFLMALQRVHDQKDVETWKTSLAEVALEFGLTA